MYTLQLAEYSSQLAFRVFQLAASDLLLAVCAFQLAASDLLLAVCAFQLAGNTKSLHHCKPLNHFKQGFPANHALINSQFLCLQCDGLQRGI